MKGDCLLAAWEQTLARSAKRTAIFDTRGEERRTFAEIEEGARRFEAESLGGCAPHAVVAIQVGNHEDWPALLLACLRREVVALPLERTMSEQEREAAFATCRVAGVFLPAVGRTRFEAMGTGEQVDWGAAPPSLLKLTSGTTAAPRAIRFRSAQLLADCVQICETMGLTEHDRNFAVVPVSHSYGFSNLITPLLARGVPMVLSRDRMPRAVLDGLSASGATVFPGMPVFFQALAEMVDLPPLEHLRLCISAGAPLPRAVARRFEERFRRPIHSFYGASECGGICYDRAGVSAREGFVGEPMAGVQLIATAEEADGSRIEVRSAAVGDGYFPEPEPGKLRDGVFAPDDLVRKEADGIAIVGRVSDVINVAGKKVNPAEVEAQLLRCSGIRAAVVFSLKSTLRNEEVAACLVAAPGTIESDVLEFCRRNLSGWQVPKRLFFVPMIPTNARGKISRREVATQFVARSTG